MLMVKSPTPGLLPAGTSMVMSSVSWYFKGVERESCCSELVVPSEVSVKDIVLTSCRLQLVTNT